ncbi:hypothetical protein BH24ACT3_BH24ACT3_00290 [soil metagenome]
MRVFARATYGDANIGWVFYDGATPCWPPPVPAGPI